MLHTVTEREFLCMVVEREKIQAEIVGNVAPVMACITAKWLKILGPAKIAIMLFVLNRTVLSGKSAQRIAVSEFINGAKNDDSIHCSGVGLGATVLRKHLRELCEQDFLTVYRTATELTGAEKEARMFEINCKKVVEDNELPSKNCQISRKTEKKVVENPLRKTTPPLAETEGVYIYLFNRFISTGRDINISIPRIVSDSRANAESRSMFQIPKPKKPRTESPTYSSALEAIAAIQKRDTTARAARSARATDKLPHMIDRLELQALLDSTTMTYLPDHRIVVTGKELGYFKKRLKESAPTDMKSFLSWLVRYWSTLATQHRAAIRRNETRSTAGERGLPLVPDFATLTYRYPYFLKAYQNFQAEGKATVKEDTRDREVEQLKMQIQKKDDENKSMRTLIRRRAPQKLKSIAPRPTIDLDTDDLPVWDSEKATKVKYGNR